MAKIDSYSLDASITDNDSLLGINSADGSTKRFAMVSIKTYVASVASGTGLSGGVEAGTITLNVEAAQTGITSILATDLKIGEDNQTKIDFETANEIHFYANNVEQVYLGDNIFGPQTDSDVDLGSTGVRWKDAYIDSITVTGEIDGASLDISGNADIDGTLEADAITINGVTLAETISDTVGTMVGSNTETGIAVTYDDSDNTLDFVIGAGIIVNSMLAADSVTGAKIADDAIDSEHYTDGSIDNAHIADDAIDSEHYAAGSIDTAHLADGAITAAKIADDAIDSEHYTDGSIDNAHIADDAIDSEHYAAGSIDTAHLADGAITAAKIADGAIVAAEIANNAVTTAKINADAVTGAKIADDAINSEHYTDGSIDTAHVADDQITQAKMADDAIGADQLAANAVVNASIAAGAAIDMDKFDGDSLASALTDFAQDDSVILSDTSDSGNLKSMTASNLEDAIFGNISGDVTLAAGGAATAAAAQTNITSLLATDIKIGEDDQTKVDFETADTINFYAGNEKQLILTDGALTPGSNAMVDLGTDALEFKDAFFDGTVEADAITIAGVTLAETISDTAGAMFTSNTETFIAATYQDADNTIDLVVPVKDEDNMASDSASHLATQQSIKAYVDSEVAAPTGLGTVTQDTVTFTSANSTDPLVIIKNTTNDTAAARLHFIKDKGAAGADGDDIGTIEFISDDSAQAQTSFAKIVAEVSESANSDEAGKLSFFVAESDGTTTALAAGLILEGEHATDGEVDVTIGAGAASTTTITGTLTMGSTATLTNAGLVAVANQSNITGVGTIASGVWNGTAIVRAYIGADAIDGSKIDDDAIDSEHYADGSIDNAHIADDAIDSEHYAAGSIDTAHIADDQITHAKIEGRYTAKATSTATGNQNLDSSAATTFLLTGNVATATLTIQNMKLGQVIDIVCSGTLSSAVITLATDFSSTTIRKVGGVALDQSVTNVITVACIDDTDNAALIHYSIAPFATDTTP